MYCKLTSKITYLSNNLVPDNKLIICSCSFRRMRAHSHFIAFGMMNLQFEIRICQKIHNKGTMSQWQIQVTIFLSGTDVEVHSPKKCLVRLDLYGVKWP